MFGGAPPIVDTGLPPNSPTTHEHEGARSRMPKISAGARRSASLLVAVLLLVGAGMVPVLVPQGAGPAQAVTTGDTVDLRVLLIGAPGGASDPNMAAWAAGLTSQGVAYTEVDAAGTLGSATVSLPALTSSATHGLYNGVVLAGKPADFAAGQLSALFGYESTFGIRQIDADFVPNGHRGVERGDRRRQRSIDLGNDGDVDRGGVDDVRVAERAGSGRHRQLRVAGHDREWFADRCDRDSVVERCGGQRVDRRVSAPDRRAGTDGPAGRRGGDDYRHGVQRQSDAVVVARSGSDRLADWWFPSRLVSQLRVDSRRRHVHSRRHLGYSDSTRSTTDPDCCIADASRRRRHDGGMVGANDFRLDQLFNAGNSVAYQAANGGVDPLLAELQKTDPATGKPYSSDFGWLSHTWDHAVPRRRLRDPALHRSRSAAEHDLGRVRAWKHPRHRWSRADLEHRHVTRVRDGEPDHARARRPLGLRQPRARKRRRGRPSESRRRDPRAGGTFAVGSYQWAVTDQFSGADSTAIDESSAFVTDTDRGDCGRESHVAVAGRVSRGQLPGVSRGGRVEQLVPVGNVPTPATATPPATVTADPTGGSTTDTTGGGMQQLTYDDLGAAGTAVPAWTPPTLRTRTPWRGSRTPSSSRRWTRWV